MAKRKGNPVAASKAQVAAAKPAAQSAPAAAKPAAPASTAKAVEAKAPVPAPVAKAPAVETAVPEAKAEVATPAVKAEAPAPAPSTADTKTSDSDSSIKKEDSIMTKTQTIDAGTIAAERIQAVIGDANERAKTAIEKGTKIVEEFSELTKGNVEALVASSKVAARGVEALGQEVAEYGRRSFEEASTAVKSFAEVKSPTDFFRLQSEYAKTQFDSLVAESSRMSETVIKLAGDVFEPLSSRYAVAAERVKSAAL